MKQKHNFAPLFDAESQILILGSFPSVKSREAEFFYGHPQNRFWRVLSELLDAALPHSIEEKQRLLYAHHIALWDVIAECDIKGSADSSISDVKANDILPIIKGSQIKQIFVNGRTAEKLYNKLILPQTKLSAIALPSTSPANAAWDIDRLKEEWKIILQYID